MQKTLLPFCILSLVISLTWSVSAQSLATKLGYTDEDKLLIIHADDLGVAHSQNAASFLAMKIGMVNSASIMMPCPWVAEVAEFARQYPDADLGLHLTLTNEWKHMNWGPVASKSEVSSLVNELGFFHDNCMTFGQNAQALEVEIELRAQIEKAIKMGINPTHLDTHMGCLIFSSPEIFETYLKLGREYEIPVMVDRFFLKAASDVFKDKMTSEDIIIENVVSASPQDYENGMAAYYENLLEKLEPGISALLIHLAFDNAEMQAVTIGKEYWGARWRQHDFDFFTSARCNEILKKQNIKLLTWREIQQKWYKQ